MTDEYALADKLKNQFRGRGAAVSGVRATSTSELMHRAEMGKDPRENVAEEAFRETVAEKKRPAGAARQPSANAYAGVRRAGTARSVDEEIAGRGHIPYASANRPADPKAREKARKAAAKAARKREKARRRQERRRASEASAAREIEVKRGSLPVAFLALCLVALVVIFSIVESFAKVYQTQNRISRMETELEELKDTAAGLRLKLEEKNDIRTIREIAVGELGMAEEDSQQRRFVSISDGERIEILEEPDSGNSPGGVLFSSIASSLGSFFERFR